MEKVGIGIRRINDACNKNNNKVVFDFSDTFWVEIFSNDSSLIGNSSENVGENVGEKLSREERKKYIMELLKQHNNLTIISLSKKLNVNPKTIERDLQELHDKVKYIGSAKGGHWEVLD
jgi:predicted HTH transcriptional regulator